MAKHLIHKEIKVSRAIHFNCKAGSIQPQDVISPFLASSASVCLPPLNTCHPTEPLHPGLSSPESYRAHAVEFANRVDRENNVSYVRKNGETVKFSKKTGEFAVITKNGIVTTYFKPDEGYAYYNKDRRNHR